MNTDKIPFCHFIFDLLGSGLNPDKQEYGATKADDCKNLTGNIIKYFKDSGSNPGNPVKGFEIFDLISDRLVNKFAKQMFFCESVFPPYGSRIMESVQRLEVLYGTDMVLASEKEANCKEKLRRVLPVMQVLRAMQERWSILKMMMVAGATKEE